MDDLISAWMWAESNAIEALGALDQWRLLTPTQAMAVMLLVTGAAAISLIHLWLRYGGRTKTYRDVVATSAMMPLAILAVLQTPSGFSGAPDDNCHKYDDGNLVYTVVDYAVVARKSTESFGPNWLLLTVHAAPRWGDEPHLCRVPMGGDKAKHIFRQLNEQAGGGGGAGSTDEFTFSFGAADEEPNVKIRSLPEFRKDGPPEVPLSRRGDA